jgi:hypothetical protein
MEEATTIVLAPKASTAASALVKAEEKANGDQQLKETKEARWLERGGQGVVG